MQIQMTEPHFSRGLCMHNTVIIGPIWKCNCKVQVETTRRITHCSKSILIQKLFCLLDATIFKNATEKIFNCMSDREELKEQIYALFNESRVSTIVL